MPLCLLHSICRSAVVATATIAALEAGVAHAGGALAAIEDRVPPEVVLGVLPTATPDKPAHLDGYVRDLGEIESVGYYVNGFLVASPTPGVNGQVGADVTLADGLNTIVLEAIDAAGNRSRAEAAITVTANAPRVALDPVAPQLGTPAVRLAGSASAPNGIASAKVLVNGALVAYPRIGSDGKFALTVPLVEGRHEVVVELRSSAQTLPLGVTIPGVPVQLRLPVVVDTVPPVVELGEVPEVTNQPMVSVRGRATDETSGVARLELYLDGASQGELAVEEGGAFEAAVWLGEGQHELSVVAYDRSGNKAASAAEVTLDSLPPTLRLRRPVAGALFGAPQVEVEVEVLDRSSSLVLLGSTASPVPAGGGRALGKVTLGAEGSQPITVLAEDAAGNRSSVSVDVLLDASAPVLAIDVADGLALGPAEGDVLPFSVAVQDLSATEVFTPSGSWALPRGGGTVSGRVGLTEGMNRFEVSATDETGLGTGLERSAVLDLTPPELSLRFDAGARARGQAELTVRATDILTGVAGVSARLAGEHRSLADHGDGHFVLAFDTTELADGPHAIAFDAHDAVGNHRTASAEILVDNTAPTFEAPSPAAGSWVRGTIDLSASASDATTGITGLQLASRGVVLATCATERCTARLDTSSLPDGLFTVTLTAVDGAGNRATTPVALVSDNTAPERSLVAPAAGATVRGPFEVRLGSTDAGFASADCTVDGASLGKTSDRSARWAFDSRTVLDGLTIVRCTVADLAGNQNVESIEVTVDNWAERFSPARLSFNEGGGLRELGQVEMRLEGANVAALLPRLAEATLWVEGTTPVRAAPDRSSEAARDDDRDGVPEVRVSFDRKHLARALLAALESDAIHPGAVVPVRLLVGTRVVATDAVVVEAERVRN